MSTPKRIIGIDLGTTNSCVAVMVGGYPQVIPNTQGYKITPSVVAYMDDGKVLVGQHAKRQSLINPQRTIYSAKRLIGRRYESEEAKKARRILPYPIKPAEDGSIYIEQGDKKLSVPEVSAKILEEMKKVAATFLAGEVVDAVITVPAYFSDGQRQATKKAGEIAGLNVVRIINEPTAAALAYGNAQKVNATIAVYDLGGGTFDISILEIRNGVFKVLATGGDTFLGGDDFDDRIIDFVAEKFMGQHQVDVRKDPASLQRLRDASEQAKCELSGMKESKITLPFIAQSSGGPLHLEVMLTRDDLEKITADLVKRTLGISEDVLKKAALSKGDLDDVLLVGGQTRMPKVHDSVSNFFGRSASKQIHPDEAVAVGAAIHGNSLLGGQGETLLLDVTPMALGIRTAGDTYAQLIPQNSTVPISKSHVFTTVTDNQKSVKIQVFQGDLPMASENEFLGEFILTSIRQAQAGVPEINVEFSIDADGIVHISATDLETGLAQSITVNTGKEEPTTTKKKDTAEKKAAPQISDEFAVRMAEQTAVDELQQQLRVALHILRKQYEAKGSAISADLQKRIIAILDNGPGFIKNGEMEAMQRLEREINRVNLAIK